MDYFNFTAEWEGYSAYFSRMIQTLNSISSFLSEYNKQKDQLIRNMKISLNNLITEVKKPINTLYKLKYISPFTKNLHKVILSLIEVITKETKENELLHHEITAPLNSFIKHLNNQNNLVFNEFKNSIDEVYKQKKKCDLSKNNYINSGNQITLLAEKINNVLSSENENEIKELNNNLIIWKTKFQKNYIEYKDTVNVTNKLFTEKNKEYFSYLTKIKDVEESKELFMNFFFEKVDNYLKNKMNNISKLEICINSLFPKKEKGEKAKKDLKNTIDEQLNNFILDPEKKIRLKNEEFVEYETYKVKLSNLINQNRMYLKEDSNNNRINFNPQEILINAIEKNSISLNYNKSKEEYVFNKEENNLIESIFLSEEIDKFKTEQLIEKVKTNFEYGQNIIDKVLERYTSSIGVQFLNENNFIKYAQLVNAVLLNKEIQQNLFEINFAIIYISEKTFYQHEHNPFYKRYLCKIISELNPNIKSKEFWYKLILIRIQITREEEAKNKTKLILKEEKKKKLEELKSKNKDIKINEDKNKPQKKIFGFGIPSIVGNLFGNNNNMTQEEKEQEEKEKKRKKEIYEEIYNKIIVDVVTKLIKDFIVHFSCFSVESFDVIDIITNVTNKYKITSEEKKIKYLMAIFNSNMYSIKSTNFRIINKEDNNINETRLEKFMNQNYLKGNSNKNTKTLIILNAMKYLPFSEYKNILLLNKPIFKLIIGILYSNILINIDEDIPDDYSKKNPIPNAWKTPNIRIKIWKYFLKYKNNINYSEITEKISKEENKQESFEMIRLDVKRMWFGDESKTEQVRKSLNNILCSLAFLHPKIGYSQGMNFIASFLYDLCGTEEEAFQIYNCILESTDYGDLFMNDLKRLNKYFYVFERLIFIYLPEVFLHLTNIKLSPKFFVSPWFITLFTNAYKSLKEKGKPKVLIWIFDNFIIEGWGAINKIGLCLMKHFERKILMLDTDELLHFLINDIINYDFFKNSNYERLRNIYDNLRIENGLIENIENEYDIKNSIVINTGDNLNLNK